MFRAIFSIFAPRYSQQRDEYSRYGSQVDGNSRGALRAELAQGTVPSAQGRLSTAFKRTALEEIIQLARAILFPGYFGKSQVNINTIKYQIGVNVERLLPAALRADTWPDWALILTASLRIRLARS
jgi:hypothetical protein